MRHRPAWEVHVFAQVRARALTNYVQVARFVGLDPYEMLRRAEISPLALENPDSLIASRAVGDLLHASAIESGCEHFGLLLAESRTLASMGPISLLLSLAGNARGVLEAMVRYQMVMNEVIVLGTEQAGGETIIRVGISAPYRSQSIELLMGMICRMISEVVGGRWHPDCAHFTHAAPADTSVHRRVFQCPLIFDSDFNGFVCATASLDAPNPAADSALARHAQRYLEMLQPDAAGSITEQARRALYLLLPAGKAGVEACADNLGLHPRALQRILEKEGRSFATLLAEVRRELALRYLSSSTHSITGIAHMTGYATPSSFTRWFCAEFGMSPAQWRAEGRQAEPPEEWEDPHAMI
jgi:AraC-like DNA-binding protein